MSLSVGYNQPAAAWGKKMTSDSGDLDFPTVDLPKDAKSCESIVHFLIGELVRTGRIRPEYSNSVMHQILKRESLGSTAVGRALAIPHAKSSLVETVVGIVGRCSQPINWAGLPDNQQVNVVCLLITPESQPGDALMALESVAQEILGRAGCKITGSASPSVC